MRRPPQPLRVVEGKIKQWKKFIQIPPAFSFFILSKMWISYKDKLNMYYSFNTIRIPSPACVLFCKRNKLFFKHSVQRFKQFKDKLKFFIISDL
ncbi:MAG: hypothetical protein ACW99L_07190, partial [Promethearchaeota archaeon]